MRKLWRPVVERITPYDAGKPLEVLKQELGLDELIRLSANENPLGPSPAVVEAIRREATLVHLYPDGGATALRAGLSGRLGVPPRRNRLVVQPYREAASNDQGTVVRTPVTDAVTNNRERDWHTPLLATTSKEGNLQQRPWLSYVAERAPRLPPATIALL